ncbi:MAG TPA: hypothetical protein ENN28_00785 [Candidatus Uhrbacteria bacterium]|nr:hypothetical protein [Candidatus Uhrbacteria bacterium]
MAEPIKDKLTKNKKRLWLIILLLLLLIIVILIYLLLAYFKAPLPGVVDLNNNMNQEPIPLEEIIIPDSFNRPDGAVLADLTADAEREGTQELSPSINLLFVAQAFAERFGSYSNQGDYANFGDLKIFMTDSLDNWVQQTYIDELKKKNPDFNIYYALETKAISTEVLSLDESVGRAEIMVKTQRQEFDNDLVNPRVFYQDILLKMVKQNNEWKVDGAFWQ